MGIEDLRADWLERIPCLTPTKMPKAVLANALFALRSAPEWDGVVGYDEFGLATMMLRPPPWRRNEHNSWKPCRWGDREDTLATEWLQHQGICVPLPIAANAVQAVAGDNVFHPVRDYLGRLEWDRTKRLDKFAAECFGAERSPYHSAVSRCLFIAGVARIMQPGCKADHVPILEDDQGAGKSRAVRAIFEPWFSDDLAELGTKDASMQASGVWGIEIAELAGMTRSEVERIKAFLSRSTDRFRPSYGRHVIKRPRQCIFVGTTNAEAYLKDETGGRRFWPIRGNGIDLDAIQRDRDQLWAEAVTLYRKGQPWWLADASVIETAQDAQAARYLPDEWQAPIAEHLNIKDTTSVGEILSEVLGIEKARWDQPSQTRVARCLRVAGWERFRGPRPMRKPIYRRRSVTNGPDSVASDPDWDQ